MNKSKLVAIFGALSIILAGCSGYVYTSVGGTVTGMVSGDTLILRTDTNYTQTLNADGAFSFSEPSNASYTISVAQQPNRTNCTVVNPSGTVGGDAGVNNIQVVCVPNVPIGGTVTGLDTTTAKTLTMYNNAATFGSAYQATVSANTSFVFPNYVVNGATYNVTVGIPPAGQYCSIANGSGTANINNLAAANNIAVTCVTGVPITIAVNGLTSGSTLNIQDVFGPSSTIDALSVVASGSYTMPFSLQDGMAYSVTVGTPQPVNQTCTVVNGAGVARVATPPTITINCQ